MKVRHCAILVFSLSALMAAASARAETEEAGRPDAVDEDAPAAVPVRPSVERAQWIREFRHGSSPGLGHMSPEERRELRRDIRAAREGVYHRQPRGPRQYDAPLQ